MVKVTFTWSMMWQDRLLASTRDTKLGAIARSALGRNDDAILPCFVGFASITSDRFLVCDCVDRNGHFHMGAFVGSVSDLERNVVGVADHLDLSAEDRIAWFAAVRGWIGTDYSERGLKLEVTSGGK